MNQFKLRLWLLIILVSISGLSQGMLLPTIAVILENHGIPSTVNGIHATALYIGVFVASPFMEAPLRKFGYKPLIIVGGLTVVLSLFAFTIWDSLLFWFILRLFIGIGDQALHFSSQTWITSFSPQEKRGRNISLYGLSFGIGFAIGPLFTRLLVFNEKLPFLIAGTLSFIALLAALLLKNEFPEQSENETNSRQLRSTFKNFSKVLRYAWAPLLPAICYGVLEASLNGNFPVYGLRLGFEVEYLSIIISAFAIGGIVFQLPLGMMSDYFGRRKVLLSSLFIGSVIFMAAGLFEDSATMLIILFFIAGMLLGSTYSLSIAYLTDTVEKRLLPAGNLLISICFSLGSIFGPFLGGLAIDQFSNFSFLYFIAIILFLIFIGLLSYRNHEHQNEYLDKTG
ncbi:MFS transporter [Caldibacillus thermolactis]|jgi:MFS family permease|uniref:MFS transporter n=1 Tax=Pallidibacillus thermolactis TaxID=251051 RepID=A0ABT2WFS0_9BACI|nr:MFS transporter [Pallidibacillus thermolactis]MCU9594532.1 MFS transporter [Pallidibacillus thermolactis]MCU9601901.1 MFS transporter [Pallidibacillus thermolactis subsp. kokeshiiformis]MED1673281.1 MFS transporter [Pallidibacillus thermolactis subsp. kokeshiiformis]